MRPLIAALILLLALPAAAEDEKRPPRDSFGAIAFGLSKEERAAAYGFAWNHREQAHAQKAAVEACSKGSGIACSLIAWFHNGCGALAMDLQGRARARTAGTEQRAEARALQACEAGGTKCAIISSV